MYPHAELHQDQSESIILGNRSSLSSEIEIYVAPTRLFSQFDRHKLLIVASVVRSHHAVLPLPPTKRPLSKKKD